MLRNPSVVLCVGMGVLLIGILGAAAWAGWYGYSAHQRHQEALAELTSLRQEISRLQAELAVYHEEEKDDLRTRMLKEAERRAAREERRLKTALDLQEGEVPLLRAHNQAYARDSLSMQVTLLEAKEEFPDELIPALTKFIREADCSDEGEKNFIEAMHITPITENGFPLAEGETRTRNWRVQITYRKERPATQPQFVLLAVYRTGVVVHRYGFADARQLDGVAAACCLLGKALGARVTSGRWNREDIFIFKS